MRVAELFGETSKEVPSDADTASHQLLTRAGYIRQLAAGIFSLLPLATRSVRKIEAILREEMDRIGGQEISMPVVHPAEPWQESGRWDAIDETMVRFADRRGRKMLLAMTHEEIVALLARSEVHSYRQLPMLVYQLQTKFRDELRTRGGLIRVREFVMKDSYSLDRDEAGLDVQYAAHYDAYFRIFARAGVPAAAVQSDVGMMGGRMAHEFMYITPVGEDTLIFCPGCGYAANREVAEFVAAEGAGGGRRGEWFMATVGGKAQLVLALTVAPAEVNPTKLQNALGATALRPAHREEIAAASPSGADADPAEIDRAAAMVIADERVPALPAAADRVVPIGSAYEGAGCVSCGAALTFTRGVEIGNIFRLGTRYSGAMKAVVKDEDGTDKPIVMGSYGIGVGRLLACAAEECRDEAGLALPVSIAPYAVNLISLARTPESAARAKELYRQMQSAGIEVLFDDREASAGMKLSEADLRGMPLRVVVSERSLKENGVEIKPRRSADASVVSLDRAVDTVKDSIAAMHRELLERAENARKWPR